MMKPNMISNIIRLGTIASIRAFSPSQFVALSSRNPTCNRAMTTSSTSSLKGLMSSGDAVPTASASSTSTSEEDDMSNKSTLTLLEHVNLNVPNHDYILDFYIHILGMGLDPRRAANVIKGNGTVWANCGASQFHLPYGETAQTIPGSIGLIYDDLVGVVGRLKSYDDDNANDNDSDNDSDNDNDHDNKPFTSYSVEGEDENGNVLSIRIVDRYDNVFYCRQRSELSSSNENEIMNTAKQPIIYSDNEEHVQEFQDVATKYGLSSSSSTSTTTTVTECKGISYVEFNVPKGNNKIEDIAEFYECVFDAPANVVTDPSTGSKIAIVGFGSIDEDTGKASQSLLFREMIDDTYEVPKYDGHHVALYVGSDRADFEKAFENSLEAGVVWVNPRFSDRVTNLNTAKKWRQFRFKNLVSLEKGKKIFELEHEVRSIEHDAWPGSNN